MGILSSLGLAVKSMPFSTRCPSCKKGAKFLPLAKENHSGKFTCQKCGHVMQK